ncbi:hypothetical protein CISG_04516 [Coccidioides immitis RMSCC 3703]|uniref:Uncharacterized protein n=1 Tax=Coccidioides immitis RMSCC 3703 TaxID=454286 RepID=A0A0J8QQJ9_COCIT|nr:hypothetical protein CISG_04516 [Coccidioides immitis RMSCC 3703]
MHLKNLVIALAATFAASAYAARWEGSILCLRDWSENWRQDFRVSSVNLRVPGMTRNAAKHAILTALSAHVAGGQICGYFPLHKNKGFQLPLDTLRGKYLDIATDTVIV